MTTKLGLTRACCRGYVVVWALACGAVGCEAGEPGFQSSSMVFTDSLDQVVSAITNGFGNGAYHSKRLVEFPYDYVVAGQTRIAVPQTNTWNVYGGPLPLTLVPRGKKMVAYDEGFVVKAEAVSPGRTKVDVKPTESSVTGGWYGVSAHFSRVLGEKYHPPVALETTNLFGRIAKQLREFRAGRTNVLPPTLDTRSGFYTHFWRDMDDKEKHDRGNWEKMVQAWREIQLLEAVTNNANATTKSVR